MNTPTRQDLECLIAWPPDTVGEISERVLIDKLLELCHIYGFGRVPQVAEQIEDLWRNPEKRTVYEKSKRTHLNMLEKARSI